MFKDREEAGKRLASLLSAYKNAPDTLVLALPRGGVIVGAVLAQALHLPLDILSARKIGAPFNREFAIGAITETGEGVFSHDIIERLNISQEYLKTTIEREKQEALRRSEHYRQGKRALDVAHKTVILVDDGVATGSTLFAAIQSLKKKQTARLIVAVPVAPPDTFQKIEAEVDEAYAILKPPSFFAVGQFYERFGQTTDEEVIALLRSYTTSGK
jgi:putative phosphoribosyl transferase